MNTKIINKLLLILVIVIGFNIINYFMLIPINIRYMGTFVLAITFIIFLIFLFSKDVFEKKYLKMGTELIETLTFTKKVWFVLIGTLLLVIFYSLSSSPIFFSKDYRDLIGDVKEKDFVADFSIINNDEIPIVDFSYAEKLGDKKIGSERGLGSEFKVGEYSDIIVDGKMVMVAPLEFNDFFKWLNNKTTPGYIIVDKITGEVELISEVEGKNLALKYLPSAYFNNNLKRHTYFSGHMTNAIIKFSFELDDNYRPYFVGNKIHKTIGLSGGADILSVVVVDAQTGEVKEYKPSEAPEWIDTIYPKEIVLSQLNDWGYYVNGFFNTLFSHRDIIKLTEGSRRVLNDGNLYHYSGFTSIGGDESTVGFAFVNVRTKETVFYKMTGATEQSAQRSAQGKVQQYGYYASHPLPINLNDEPTFFVTLKDSSGLIKQYGLVNIIDFSIVGTGETISEAVNSYIKALNKEVLPDKNVQEIKGKVARIGFDIQEGLTTYYIVLENNEGLFYGKSTVSPEINVTKVGDNVKISVNNNLIVSFDNLDI